MEPPFTTLLGPFVGELGWEIVAWQSWCRWYAHHNPGRYIAVGFRERAMLYEDFATFYPLKEQLDPDQADSFRNRLLSRDAYHKLVGHYSQMVFDVLGPIDNVIPAPYLTLPIERARERPRMFVPLGQKVDRDPESVLLFPRHRRGAEGLRNWGANKWGEIADFLLNQGKKLVIAGHPTGSCLAEYQKGNPRVTKLIGKPLFQVVEALRRVKFAVGLQSGTSSLTLLTQTPLMSFGMESIGTRIASHENPLNTPCRHYHSGTEVIAEIPTSLVKDGIRDFESQLDNGDL